VPARPDDAATVFALVKMERALEALPRDAAHEPERQALEARLYAALDALDDRARAAWRAWCIADADRPGRWVPRPSLAVRHAPCLGFGCAACDGGVDPDAERALVGVTPPPARN